MNPNHHQTQCFEYRISGTLDGLTQVPEVQYHRGFDKEQVYVVDVTGNGGLFSVRFGGEGDAPYSDRVITGLYIEAPLSASITVEVVDADSLRQQKVVTSVTSDTVYLETPIIVPQASMLKITGPSGSKVRISWNYIEKADQYLSAVCCGDAPVPPTPTASGTERRTYGSVATTYFGDAYPATQVSVLNAAANQGHLDLMANITEYTDCLWDVIQDDGAGNVTVLDSGIQFGSIGDVVTYINTNVANDGNTFQGSVVFHCYDLVSGDVAPPTKIHGQNAILARLRSGTRYWSPIEAHAFPSAWTGDQTALAAGWQQAWGTAFPVAPGTWSNNEYAAFWFSTNRRRTYMLSSTFIQVDLLSTGSKGRQAMSGGVPVPAPVGAYTISTPGAVPAYFSVDKAGNFQNAYRATPAFVNLPIDLVSGNSVALGYPIANGNAQALLVKPVGIDLIFSNYFDQSQLRLEAVASWQSDGQRKLRRLTPDLPGSGRDDLTGPFTADQWARAAVPNIYGTLHGHTNHPGPIQFQFRDLTTGRVSKFATAQVYWRVRQRFMPLAALIRNDPRS